MHIKLLTTGLTGYNIFAVNNAINLLTESYFLKEKLLCQQNRVHKVLPSLNCW
jgi:hypothetical protein